MCKYTMGPMLAWPRKSSILFGDINIPHYFYIEFLFLISNPVFQMISCPDNGI